MKNSLIFIKPKENLSQLKLIVKKVSEFCGEGVFFDDIEIISSQDDLFFKRKLGRIKESYDNVIIVGGDCAEFPVNEMVAEEFDTILTQNERAEEQLKSLKEKIGGEYSSRYAEMPFSASIIPNGFGYYQGYMIEDIETALFVLPGEEKGLTASLKEFVSPYFKSKAEKPLKTVLKYFGKETAVNNAIEKGKQIFPEIEVYCEESFGDYKIELRSAQKDKSLFNRAVTEIADGLGENLYSVGDYSLGQILFDSLKLKNLKISVAESFTGGGLVSEIIKNPGASDVVYEGVVAYSNKSKEDRLGVSREDLFKFGAVSSNVAYEMAIGLLKKGCDIALSTTGIAGPNSDGTEKPVGLCYIAVGTEKEVHVYKYNLKGDRNEITETAKNIGLFLAIKRIKNI